VERTDEPSLDRSCKEGEANQKEKQEQDRKKALLNEQT